MNFLNAQFTSFMFLLGVLLSRQSEAFSPSSLTLVSSPSRCFVPNASESQFDSISTQTRSSTRLFSEPKKKMTTNEIIGIDRGLYLIAIVMFINVWIFSIPPEFRRAKICSEEQVIQYPDSGCMTGTKWVGGVRDYYANGGGISFDFSIEKKSQPKWMGGEQPMQK
jgi:hypothetical protein